MVLPEKTQEVLDYIKAHGNRVSTDELVEAFQCKIASITARVNRLTKEGVDFAYREKIMEEGKEKPVTYVQLTEAGINFVPTPDAE